MSSGYSVSLLITGVALIVIILNLLSPLHAANASEAVVLPLGIGSLFLLVVEPIVIVIILGLVVLVLVLTNTLAEDTMTIFLLGLVLVTWSLTASSFFVFMTEFEVL